MTKRVKLVLFVLLMACHGVFSQAITTASDYFKTVSDYYASLKDYEADVEIVADKQEMSGKVSYKRPELLRIDFTKPQDQVIVFNGDQLTIYLPNLSSVLQQSVQTDSSNSAASLATSQGLALMRRYYMIGYEVGQAPVALEPGSNEMVMKLLLVRRNTTEAFRSIKLAVNPETKLIRRIEAVTSKGEVYTFNFIDYKINQDISEQRFIYEAPASANNYNNFLFAE